MTKKPSIHLGGAAEIDRQVRFAKEFFVAKMWFIYKDSKFLGASRFSKSPSSPSPFSQYWEKGGRIEVLLPAWERDLG